ncbi:MAG: universal stress protein [Holophagaceae bacterium]|nr:universal stress protein [Holophagaceae bacterium]
MINRVLVGIDFSEASRRALERAAQWAARLKVPLIAMHVMPQPAQAVFQPYAPMADPGWFQKLEPDAKNLLDEWLAAYPGSTSLIRAGNTARMLVAEADADTLLVIGNVGHGALDALLFGSTADRVIRNAQGDVLVVRAESRT